MQSNCSGELFFLTLNSNNMWTNNFGESFPCKADAFNWMNNEKLGIDQLHLYCDGERRYTKTPFGIFDCYGEYYINGLLPVEYYA